MSALGIVAFDDIAAIIPNGPQIATARDLVKRHGILTERLERAASEAGRHQLAITAAERELDGIGEPPNVIDLAAVVTEARAEGEPRRRLPGLQTKLGQEQTRLAAALAKVPLWGRGLEPLVALISTNSEMIDRTAGTLAAATAGFGDAKREVDRLSGERAEAAGRRDEVRRGRPVPDAAAVAEARSHRDHGWSLIRRCKFEGEPLDDEIEAYAKRVGIVTAFERAVGEVTNSPTVAKAKATAWPQSRRWIERLLDWTFRSRQRSDGSPKRADVMARRCTRGPRLLASLISRSHRIRPICGSFWPRARP